MIDRLTPVESCGGAEAIFSDMPVEIAQDDVIADVAGSGREVAPAPEPLALVTLADMLELLLDLARQASLCQAHEVVTVKYRQARPLLHSMAKSLILIRLTRAGRKTL